MGVPSNKQSTRGVGLCRPTQVPLLVAEACDVANATEELNNLDFIQF